MARPLNVAALLLAAAPAFAQRVDVGTHGTTLSLPAPWQRKQLDKDLGKDQFRCTERGGLFASSKECYLVVLEAESLLESDAEFARALDQNASVGHEARTEMRRLGDIRRATRRCDETLNGMSLTFRLEQLSVDGLSLFLMAWSKESDKNWLDQKVNEVLDGLAFPPAESAWRRSLAPVTNRVRAGGTEVAFDSRPFVLHARECEGGQLVHLLSEDEQHAIFAFESKVTSADQMLDDSVAAVGGAVRSKLVKVARDDVKVGDVVCRRQIANDDMLTFHLLAVPLRDGGHLDLRYVSTGAPVDPRGDRELFYRTLRIAVERDAVELPPFASELATHAATTPPLPGSSRIGTTKLFPTVLHTFDERVVVVGWNAAPEIIDRDGTRAISFSQVVGDCVRFADRWLGAAKQTDEVLAIDDSGQESPQPFTATAFDVAGGDLLLARKRPGFRMPAMTGGERTGDQLIRRTPTGREDVVAEFDGLEIQSVAALADGRTALLQCRELATLWSAQWQVVQRLVRVDLATGQTADVGAWTSIHTVVGSHDEWLVNGVVDGGGKGIHRVSRDGSITLLCTLDGLYGVDLRGDALVYVDARILGDKAVCSIPRSGIPEPSPLSPRHVAQIGAELIGGQAPRTSAEIDAALARIDARARELCGVPMPRDPAAVDELLAACALQGRTFTPAGRATLSLAITAALLAGGARWVEPAGATWLDWAAPCGAVADTAFAILHAPAALVSSAFDAEEGMTSVIAATLQRAEGRVILLSHDLEALTVSRDAAVPGGLHAALDRGDGAALVALLQSIGANSFARESLLEQLVGRRQLDLVEQIAGEFVRRDDATPADFVAWLSARIERTTAAGDAEQLVTDAAAAVRRFPQHVGLYLVLGLAYERSKPAEPAFALTCYRRVLKLVSWGPDADAARAAIERLDRR